MQDENSVILPDSTFYMRERDESIEGDNPFKWVYNTTKELFGGKKVLVVGLPGAFTPTCSNNQLPGYEKMFDDFAQLGFDEIYCTAVNDAFVMHQWAKSLGVEKVKMLPDGNGDFARQLGFLVDKSNLGFGKRSWRYAMSVSDMKVDVVFSESRPMNNCPIDPYEYSAPEYVYNQLVPSL